MFEPQDGASAESSVLDARRQPQIARRHPQVARHLAEPDAGLHAGSADPCTDRAASLLVSRHRLPGRHRTSRVVSSWRMHHSRSHVPGHDISPSNTVRDSY